MYNGNKCININGGIQKGIIRKQLRWKRPSNLLIIAIKIPVSCSYQLQHDKTTKGRQQPLSHENL